ncbi:MAG: tryptophanase [Anaerolineae bacterium]|nr:tryptophanase [Anaerolineae bacterium]
MPSFPLEPFRIKMIEPVRILTRAEREARLKETGYSVFNLRAEDIYIDLLTDSGTNAMSDYQWAGLLHGDESYAGSRNYYNLGEVVEKIFGFKHWVPTHQGRSAEHILFGVMVKPGDLIPNNTHFGTTKGNLRGYGGETIDLAVDAAYDLYGDEPFKGNMDIEKLERFITEAKAAGKHIPLGMTTITNNSSNGFAVSLANIRATAEVYRRHDIPFFIDACRYAENAYLIKQYEPECAGMSILEIANALFGCADGMLMSGKKDALVNMGGLLCMNDDELAKQVRKAMFYSEGFYTYGGLAGRDLEANARGLLEGIDESYLAYRIAQTRYLAERIRERCLPCAGAVVWPPSGHAVFLNAGAMLPHLPGDQRPGAALLAAMYLAGGIRAGNAIYPRAAAAANDEAPLHLVRLAIPRRVYTQTHFDFVAEVLGEIVAQGEAVPGIRLAPGSPDAGAFDARFEPVS